MKIAVLISGELRTFDICRPTMTFLNDERVDIYVSTWDKSVVKNDLLKINKNEDITEDNILKILGKPATILIEPLSCIDEKKYNSKMIHRWLAGFELIKLSNIEYDYVLVIRPDLFFDKDSQFMFTIDSLIADGDKQFAWYEKGHKLQDNLFWGKFSTLNNLFARLSIDIWEKDVEGDWHTWWTNFVNWDNIVRLGGLVPFTFCRGGDQSSSFNDIVRIGLDWRDAGIVNWITTYNDRTGPVVNWGQQIVDNAMKKYEEGYFKNTYKDKRIAVLISGEYRTFATCRQTMKFLDDPNVDVYFSTWTTSHIKNDKLEIDIFEEITEEKIIQDLGFKPKGISLINQEEDIFHQTKMVKLIQHGLALINKNEYSHLLIIRPDLHFLKCTNMDEFIKKHYGDYLYVGWADFLKQRQLGDIMFFAKIEDIFNIFNDVNLVNDIQNLFYIHTWHSWWYERIIKIKHVKNFDIIWSCEINRMGSINNYSVLIDAKNWTNSKSQENFIKIPKIALIISGLLRNFDTACLSLPIWGDTDKYLVTWEGLEGVHQYTNLGGIKNILLSNFDNDFLKRIDGLDVQFKNNIFRMVYLWDQAVKKIDLDYDFYVFIRPDVFYWTNLPTLVPEIINSQFNIGTNYSENSKFLDNKLVIINHQHVNEFSNIFDNFIAMSTTFINDGIGLSVHHILWEMFKDKLHLFKNLDNAVTDVIVRDTYQRVKDDNYGNVNPDSYNYDLYKAIFYDTAAHWKRTHGTCIRCTMRSF